MLNKLKIWFLSERKNSIPWAKSINWSSINSKLSVWPDITIHGSKDNDGKFRTCKWEFEDSTVPDGMESIITDNACEMWLVIFLVEIRSSYKYLEVWIDYIKIIVFIVFWTKLLATDNLNANNLYYFTHENRKICLLCIVQHVRWL